MTADVFWCFVPVFWFGANCNRLLIEQVNKWQIPNSEYIFKWQIPNWNINLSDKFQSGILSEQNQKLLKMVRIVAENVSEDALRKYYCEYMSIDSDFDDSDSCEVCNLPKLFHTRSSGRSTPFLLAPAEGWGALRAPNGPSGRSRGLRPPLH